MKGVQEASINLATSTATVTLSGEMNVATSVSYELCVTARPRFVCQVPVFWKKKAWAVWCCTMRRRTWNGICITDVESI